MSPHPGKEKDDTFDTALEEGDFRSSEDIFHQVISILAEHRPFGVTVPEIIEDIGDPIYENWVEHALDDLEQNDMATVEDGYWSLTQDDVVLANSNATMISSFSINTSEWGEYDDDSLHELPGIGEQ